MKGGEWQMLVESFFLDTYNWTRIKYGQLSQKLFASLGEYGRQLDWTKVFDDFKKYCLTRGKLLIHNCNTFNIFMT